MGQNPLFALLFALLCTPAFAQQLQAPVKPPLAKFSLQLPLLKYTSSSVKTDKATGESTNESISELSTQVLEDGFIGVGMGRLAIYFYPFFDGNNFVSAGYMITESIELGADLGLNSGKNRDSTLIGAWGYHYMNIGSLGLENGLSLTLTSNKSEVPPAAPVETSETAIKASSTVTYPLMRNLRYVGGIFIRNKSVEAEGGDKSSIFQFGFILAGLRMKWL